MNIKKLVENDRNDDGTYDTMSIWRLISKGFHIAVNLDEFEELVQSFPANFPVHTLFFLYNLICFQSKNTFDFF